MDDLLNIAIQIAISSWDILEDSAIFIIIGFFFAGLVKVFLPMNMIQGKLGGRNIKSVINASLLGAPLPLCSCSVIPTALALRNKGASKGAVNSFLISTPETGIDSISISYALLDPILTIFRPIAAVITAIFAGGLELLLGDGGKGESQNHTHDHPTEDFCPVGCGHTCESKPVDKDENFANGMRFAFVDMFDDLAGWLVMGIIAAGAIMVLVPDTLFNDYFSNNLIAMPAMLILGAPLYICATSSTPVAAAMIIKGLSPGAALVFLLAGPATNIGSIMILRKQIGVKSTSIYLFAIAVGSVTLGLTLDMVYSAAGINATVTMGHAVEMFPDMIREIGALIFVILVGASLYRYLRRKYPSLALAN